MTTQSNTDTQDLLKAGVIVLGAITAGAALIAAYAIYAGAILWIMWGWFMVPLGVPTITVAWAIGICTLVTMFVRPIGGKGQTKVAWHDVWLRPLFLLGVAYVAKQFM